MKAALQGRLSGGERRLLDPNGFNGSYLPTLTFGAPSRCCLSLDIFRAGPHAYAFLPKYLLGVRRSFPNSRWAVPGSALLHITPLPSFRPA